MKKKWLVAGLAALTLTAAVADTCPPVKHSHRTIARWTAWRTAHPKWHPRKLLRPVICTPAAPAALPPPPFEPFQVDDQEQNLVTEIETSPPSPQGEPPLELDTGYYGWMIPDDIGVPDRGRAKCHWPHCHKAAVPEPPTILLMLAGLAMLWLTRRRRMS